jgi:hypothetical protein
MALYTKEEREGLEELVGGGITGRPTDPKKATAGRGLIKKRIGEFAGAPTGGRPILPGPIQTAQGGEGLGAGATQVGGAGETAVQTGEAFGPGRTGEFYEREIYTPRATDTPRDYVPIGARTPEQQRGAFQQVALQDPRRYASASVEAPESRLGVFTASGERIDVPTERRSAGVNFGQAPSIGRTAQEQLAAMRALREPDRRAKLERAANVNVSGRQGVVDFFSALSKRKAARSRLAAAEKADVEREKIGASAGASAAATAARERIAAGKRAEADRQYAFEVAKFGATEAGRRRDERLKERGVVEQETAGRYEREYETPLRLGQQAQEEARQLATARAKALLDPEAAMSPAAGIEAQRVFESVSPRTMRLGELGEQVKALQARGEPIPPELEQEYKELFASRREEEERYQDIFRTQE